MRREKLLALGYTEEQVTELLDLMHKTNGNITKENEKLKADLDNANNKIAGLTQVEQEYNALKQSQLTEQEKVALKQKEIDQNLAESRRIRNEAKARTILSSLGELDENIIKSIVTDDENATITNATALLNQINNIREQTVNQTKQDMLTLDVKPTPSNDLEPQDSMTWEKFDSMSTDEQNKFAMEHPDEFAKL